MTFHPQRHNAAMPLEGEMSDRPVFHRCAICGAQYGNAHACAGGNGIGMQDAWSSLPAVTVTLYTQAHVDAAVARERERCATLADGMMMGRPAHTATHDVVLYRGDVAAAIRATEEPTR